MSKKLTIKEKGLIKDVLLNVFGCMEFDPIMSDGVPMVDPSAKWTDGGRFLQMLTTEEMTLLFTAIKKLQ
jgi:hypothetical protein